jgi:hypothetical protein
VSYSKCPYQKQCRLYNNLLKLDKSLEEVYKSIYCTTNKWTTCKRYLTIKELGETPDFIMPNSTFSMEAIAHQLEQEKFLNNYLDEQFL